MNDVLNTTDLTKIYGNSKALDKLNMRDLQEIAPL